MKKLTLKSKLFTCLILLCLFFVQSCRKDRLNNDNYLTDNKKIQKIDEATIQKWMDTNPAAQALTLDWKNAKQTVIDGKNVVRIPTLNIDKISSLNKSLDIKLNKLLGNNLQAGKGKIADAQNVNQNNYNYYNQHPPEVFFVQENNKEYLHTFILNFVPTNTTKEFGQDSLWTGKLYEWNLRGDTLLVQEVSKNKIVKRYGIKMSRQTAGNETLNTTNGQLTLNHNNKKISGAWADFWKNVGETIAEIWGDIGDFFGVATYNYNKGRNVWDRIDWEAIGSFFDGIFGGGGGGGGYGYSGSGYNIYNSYTPGIQNPYNGIYGSGNYSWDPYYNSGDDTPHGPNAGTQTFNSTSLSYLLGKINLTPEQITFLRDNDDIAISLENYLRVNGETYENFEFASWAVKYLEEDKGFSDLPNWIQRLSFLKKLSTSQLAEATSLTNNIIRSVEEQFIVEAPFTNEELNTISNLIIAYNAEDYFNNTSQFSTLLANPNDDDPFWNFVKSKLRRFLGIDQPKTHEERFEDETFYRNGKILGTRIQTLYEHQKAVFSLIPGYSVIDAIAMNDGYTAAAVNTSIDIFGGSLLKAIGSPLLKLGKNSFPVFNLGLKYPNIAAKLRSFSISEFTVIKRSNTEKVIIIGESMNDRILPAQDVFKKIFKNAETFKPSAAADLDFAYRIDEVMRLYGRNRLTDAEMRLTKVYRENVDWMIEKLENGYNVIDIGPKIPGAVKSPSYGMERSFIYKK